MTHDTDDARPLSTETDDDFDLAAFVAARAADAEHGEPVDKYTDAVLGGRFAREHLSGRFYYTKGMGWLRWDGMRWAPVPEEVVHEECRVWVLAQYQKSVADFLDRQKAGRTKPDENVGNDAACKGWTAAQGRQRLTSIPATARGLPAVLRDAARFDTEHDLLNTLSGVVDLRSGEVKQHHPSGLHTKITAARYVPEAADRAIIAKALSAYPEDTHAWLQVRMGEAVTGHGGKELVLMDGTGNNGKTALTGALKRALGGYGATLPNTLLLSGASKGSATPEKMELRGIRFGYIEETPEGGYLEANAVKELLDAESIKGRQLYRDYMEWTPTHSLFLNTNNIPSVPDTDDGAWRRLKRINCPYRFRDIDGGEALELPQDRPADTTLKDRLNNTEHGREAILAWAIEGARTLLGAGSLKQAAQEPASVTAATTEWRKTSDDILRFFDACLELDPDAWVAKSDLYATYREWAIGQGSKAMTMKTLTSRMVKHGLLMGKVSEVQRSTPSDSLSRPQGFLINGLLAPLPARPTGWGGIGFLTQGSEQDL